ncbi:hypothetical protein C2845_PM06G27230 [Panicum miliaceum]|uniref:Wound-induced basic protein n=1 Tax=Panicum miliaceum TaxID=4540 RepID=A0A3L6R6S0_PANMI|nr:hypothetical protein C2845_PM06G27230 [Panicum miliaceum]
MIYDVNSPLFRSFLSQKGGASDKSKEAALSVDGEGKNGLLWERREDGAARPEDAHGGATSRRARTGAQSTEVAHNSRQPLAEP